MRYYYIAFRDPESQGPVIGYGDSTLPTSGINPIGSEEIFDNFADYQSRLSRINQPGLTAREYVPE